MSLEQVFEEDLIDINLPNTEGKTPLMAGSTDSCCHSQVAARNGHAKVVAALLKAGADAGLVDKTVKDQKITAIEYAKGWLGP